MNSKDYNGKKVIMAPSFFYEACESDEVGNGIEPPFSLTKCMHLIYLKFHLKLLQYKRYNRLYSI
jgi:hypothetical protein